MHTGTNPWDDDYRRRGKLWGGSAPAFPRLPASARVLELGCGSGKTVSMLLQQKTRVTAVDISVHAALLCRNSCTEQDLLQVVVADTQDLPFRSGSFDAVVASHIAGHLLSEGRSRSAREAVRLLAPGGILYFRDFSDSDFRRGNGTEIEEGTFLRKNGIFTHYFTLAEIPELFCGLSAVSLDEHRWKMRVKGNDLQRAEIVAEFRKAG